ncbi:LppX_LprAFG lipoprotein [Streptomyces xanthochromogenes]|uniref:LppX_LprAFG lipoprotein n=1 Tax=Streptomyces xanthochromogenes TaxID=67384 RepID=UPI0038293E40
MRRPLALAATAFVLCTACTRVNDPDAQSAVRKAVDSTRQTSAHISTMLDLTDGAGTKAQIATDGGFDMAADRGRIDVRIVEGQNRGDLIFANGKVYTRNVEPEEVDHSWVWSERDTAQAHYLFRAPDNDPEHTLLQVSRMTRVHAKGKETVNGVEATRYTGNIDYETMVLRLAADTRQKLDDAVSQYKAAGREMPFTAEVWIDGQGHVVQARLTMKDAATTYAELTMKLSDLGKPVTVTPPPADETIPSDGHANLLSG